MNDLHVFLMKARKKWLEKERVHRELQSLNQERADLLKKEQEYSQKLNEEEEDVEELERMSLTNLFVTITGKKLERLEKEKQEVAAVRLKWREVQKSLADVEKEIKEAEASILEFGNPKKDYDALYNRKKHFLISKGEDNGERLLEISEKRSRIQAELTEMNEAIVAGKAAMNAMREASDSLTSAENWGALDMLGGGLLTTAVKHSRVDDADTAIHTAQRHLRKFASEINDLGEHYDVNIRITGSLSVADYFLDGLIVDWFVQNRIQSSHEEVKEIRRKTQDVLLDLESLRKRLETEEAELHEEMDRIIRLA